MAASYPALVTLRAVPGLPSLRRRDLVRAFEAALAALRDRPVISPARSWLLRVGWLRWGRIDLAETPGS